MEAFLDEYFADEQPTQAGPMAWVWLLDDEGPQEWVQVACIDEADCEHAGEMICPACLPSWEIDHDVRLPRT